MNFLLEWLLRQVRREKQPIITEKPTLRNLIEEPISAELAATTLLRAIEERNWWQGSVIPAADLSLSEEENRDVAFWVIASQPCNLYNPCFKNVPVFELVAASEVSQCDPGKSKGDNPRILHVKAESVDKTMALELNIQRRRWLPRNLLAEIQASVFHIRDALRNSELDWFRNQWQDNFASWLARSYTRIALPNEFNDAMKASRLREVIESKLAKHKDELYGVYFSIDSDTDNGWDGKLGEMPPPYLLNIMLVTHEDADPSILKERLVKQLFEDKIQDPANASLKLTRVELAQQHNIRLIKTAVDAKSVSELTLLELKSLVRYSLIDHLSDSSMAAG